MTSTRLSNNDSSVLSALFDPESSLSSTVQVHNMSASQKSSRIQWLEEQESLALSSINQELPESAEVEHSISQLTTIIESEPAHASAWNNRAQARRLLLSDKNLPDAPEAVADILRDLSQAIALATPLKTSMIVSSGDSRVLGSAHTHRGYLLLLASKSEVSHKMLASAPTLRDLSRQDLEEAASREFTMGGRYGNEMARQLAVKTNPYAKLCGSIVKEALTKEISDFYQPQPNLVE